MDDGINARKGDREVRVKDVAELLAESLPPNTKDVTPLV
jgi:hypothetical protein